MLDFLITHLLYQLLLEATDAGDLFVKLRDIGKEIMDPEVLIAAAYKAYKVPNSNNTNTSSVSSSNYSRKRVDSNSMINSNMLPPKDLVGLGLAHLGPMPISSIPSDSGDLTDASNFTDEYAIEHKFSCEKFADTSQDSPVETEEQNAHSGNTDTKYKFDVLTLHYFMLIWLINLQHQYS